MKLSALLTLLTFSSTITAASFGSWVGSQEQTHLSLEDDPLNVPGANPLTFCENPEKNQLTITVVDLEPNPPEA